MYVIKCHWDTVMVMVKEPDYAYSGPIPCEQVYFINVTGVRYDNRIT